MENADPPQSARRSIIIAPMARDCVPGLVGDIHGFRRRLNRDEYRANRGSCGKQPSACAISKPSLVPDAAAVRSRNGQSDFGVIRRFASSCSRGVEDFFSKREISSPGRLGPAGAWQWPHLFIPAFVLSSGRRNQVSVLHGYNRLAWFYENF